MRLSRQFQACFFFFFIRKDIASQKSPKRKASSFTILEVCARKKLLPLLFSVSLFLFCWFIFACDVFLYAQNLFVKKKNKQAWNCLDNLSLLYYSHKSGICFYTGTWSSFRGGFSFCVAILTKLIQHITHCNELSVSLVQHEFNNFR